MDCLRLAILFHLDDVERYAVTAEIAGSVAMRFVVNEGERQGVSCNLSIFELRCRAPGWHPLAGNGLPRLTEGQERCSVLSVAYELPLPGEVRALCVHERRC